jgi:cellulose 1,4-beta-cellobiosidase
LISSCQSVIVNSNPYIGADVYVIPQFEEEIQVSVADYPGQASLLNSALFPVSFWIDRIAKIPNITGILDGAKAQQAQTGRQVLVPFIIYDLPNRDCAAAASNGELVCADSNCVDGLTTYKTQYIDPIVQIFKNYPEQTIVALVEPDSLPNLATNLAIAKCSTAQTAYMQGIAYAIQQLATVENVAIYLDAAHGGWLGWPNNLNAITPIFTNVLGMAGGVNLIRGFATNTANYQPLGSLSSTYDPCNLQSQYNNAIDEVHYVNLLNQALTSAGITNKGYIIDTSRNGVPNTRSSCSNWCNIKGSGLGIRPTTSTSFTGINILDALHWAKVPGESDGTSNTSSSRYDFHCGSVDSVLPAPEAGTWFPSYFLSLVENANPALTITVPTSQQQPGGQTSQQQPGGQTSQQQPAGQTSQQQPGGQTSQQIPQPGGQTSPPAGSSAQQHVGFASLKTVSIGLIGIALFVFLL